MAFTTWFFTGGVHKKFSAHRLALIITAAMAILFASQSLITVSGSAKNVTAEVAQTDDFPTLQGQAAVEHLQKQGLYSAASDALHTVLTTNYVELTEMHPADSVYSAWFGYRVAISGNTLVVSAPHLFGYGSDSSAVYIFVRSGNVFSQQAKLSGYQTFDNFGQSIAISGDTLVVGAGYQNTQALGKAYVFVRTGGVWALQDVITPGLLVTDYHFGNDVAISGDTIVVGDYYDTVGTNFAQGSAYVFVRSGTHWSKQQKLIANDGAVYEHFGNSVAISNDTILIGAYHDKIGGNDDQGSAYVFKRTNTTWTQQQKLTGSDGADGDVFGWAVALEGDTAVIGAPYADSGAVYIFTRSGSSWSEQQKLTVSNASINANFGSSVALYGDTLVAGARFDYSGNYPGVGSAFVFSRSGTTWSQQQKLTDQSGYNDNWFGTSAAIGPDTIMVGSPHKYEDKGAAIVFGLPPNTPPAISTNTVLVRAGTAGLVGNIATVSDIEDAENTLLVNINGGNSATANGVTISGLNVDGAGVVTATIATTCGATNASFTLQVTDTGGASAQATLSVAMAPNTPPTLAYNSPQSISTGGSKIINPMTGPSDNGLINSIVVQNVSPAFSGSITVNPQGVVSVSNASPAGNYTVTIRATDQCGAITNASFALNVSGSCPAITVNPASLPNGTQGTTYNQTLTASGGAAPYSYIVSAGALPGGLSLAANGTLTGPLTASGTFNFTVKATDANGCFGTRAYTVTVNGGGGNPSGLQFYPLPKPIRLFDTRAAIPGYPACQYLGQSL
ncbi:MAG: putative Ig domain-containing protein, partial [Blastocatellales bacterium]